MISILQSYTLFKFLFILIAIINIHNNSMIITLYELINSINYLDVVLFVFHYFCKQTKLN